MQNLFELKTLIEMRISSTKNLPANDYVFGELSGLNQALQLINNLIEKQFDDDEDIDDQIAYEDPFLGEH